MRLLTTCPTCGGRGPYCRDCFFSGLVPTAEGKDVIALMRWAEMARGRPAGEWDRMKATNPEPAL